VGLSLRRILKPIGRGALALTPIFAPGTAPAFSALSTAFAPSARPTMVNFMPSQFDSWSGIGSGIQNIAAPGKFPTVQPAGAISQIGMGGMTTAVAGAISKLARIAGVVLTPSNLARQGLRLWTSATAFARRHPGVSVVSFLASLGLSIQEAGEFLSWGQSRQRRRRRRGISWSDIRRTRRVIRVMRQMEANLAGLSRRRVGRPGRTGSTIIAQN